MSQWRQNKYYPSAGNLEMAWPVPPENVMWVGGTYARHPRHFPKHQNEDAWVYVHLRPLGIPPDPFLSKLHQQSKHYRYAPDEIHRFPGTLPDSVRVGKLWTYMKTHKLHESLWYGHALCEKNANTTLPSSIIRIIRCKTCGSLNPNVLL